MLGDVMEANGRMAVLSVDDLAANRFVVRALLEPLGIEVDDAASGAEALELAVRKEFAVALVDVMMPEMDGLETLVRLRADPRSAAMPVILITAGDMDLAVVEHAYELGAVDWIAKPIAPAILRGKVRAFVSLYEVNRQLRARDAALASKNRHLAVLAHDLRNPLSTIVAGASMLQRELPASRVVALADRVARAASRMGTMIGDLLDHARVEAGTLMANRASLDLGQLCGEIVEEFEVADANRRIGLSLAGDLQGEWDPARMYQVLSNLIGNATRFGNGKADVSADGRSETVEIAVHNDGPPIAPEVLPLIFEPFNRGPDQGAGLGLGLYIAREIVRSHDGEIAARSSIDGGTTFTIRLGRHSA